ncbi:MAG: hypothetical protein GC162_10830 [Planctomycetes bacterium]|nr:hypothetical protein [Planctomycetota bacterium]
MDINSIGTQGSALSRIAARRAAEQGTNLNGSTPRPGDSVEVSAAAQLLARLSDLPDVRHDLVDRVRSEIQSGEYETPGKLDAAVNALIDDAQLF